MNSRCSIHNSPFQRINERHQEIRIKDIGLSEYQKRKEWEEQIQKLSGKYYLDTKIAQDWVERYEEVIRGINGFVNYIRNKKGTKR